MGDPSHVAMLQKGVPAWNDWRKANPRLQPDLTHVDLSGQDLCGVDFRGVGLFEANLLGTRLVSANLRQARLVRTCLDNADISEARVWGASVWDVSLSGTTQTDLIITPTGDEIVTVDDLDLAQFVYLLINNRNLRRVIDTLTSKVVLILGRFSPTRKPALALIKTYLRHCNYVPVLFDFDGPDNRDLSETVTTLAHLARFVIADLTEPSCIPHELRAIVPDIQVPIITLIASGHLPYAMFADLCRKYTWVHPPIVYLNDDDLQTAILPEVIAKAENAIAQLRKR